MINGAGRYGKEGTVYGWCSILGWGVFICTSTLGSGAGACLYASNTNASRYIVCSLSLKCCIVKNRLHGAHCLREFSAWRALSHSTTILLSSPPKKNPQTIQNILRKHEIKESKAKTILAHQAVEACYKVWGPAEDPGRRGRAQWRSHCKKLNEPTASVG